MYKNVRVAMVMKNMTMIDLSNATGIRYQTLSEKLRGNSELSLKEAVAIKNALGASMPLEVLFTNEQVAE